MCSQSTLLPSFTPPLHTLTLSSPAKTRSKYFTGRRLFGANDGGVNFDICTRCTPRTKTHSSEGTTAFQKNQPSKEQTKLLKDHLEEEGLKYIASDEIGELVNYIRSRLNSMSGGDLSISAYDTAWVALVEDIHGSGGSPQFPSTLEWIANNQLLDGSWGDEHFFSAYDRILSTLACVVALRTWNLHPHKVEKGLTYIKQNICKIENEKAEHMTIGFEIVFPSLVEIAKKLDIDIPCDSQFLQDIDAKRKLKLQRIPKDIMENIPTTILYSLEGMQGLNWEKLLKIQNSDGSFLSSPASTASVLIQTKDENCFRYLNKLVEKFNGGVPNVFPVDMFEWLWGTDRLQRLGISRYFQQEINECLDYAYRYWSENGLCWASNSPIQGIDETSMGFRLLRLHGREVSKDAFRHFKNGDQFFCLARQSMESVTAMFNLYRASQVLFPGEKILEDAYKFSYKFLREKQVNNQLLDKWIISKHLSNEIGYALDMPYYASLPRVETRFYLEQYGGDQDDIWIGKVLYRMHNVNNKSYLELAKLDYNHCQGLHQVEWNKIQKWYEECNLGQFGISRERLLLAYYIASASTFEPEKSKERNAWAKTKILIEMVEFYFKKEGTSREQRSAFIQLKDQKQYQQLPPSYQWWEMLLMTWNEEKGGFQGEGEHIVRTINLCASQCVSEDIWTHPHYKHLSDLINGVCHQLHQFQNNKVNGMDNGNTFTPKITTIQIESDMQKLMQLVLQNSSDSIEPRIKRIFLYVAKSFYYTSHCDSSTINFHIAKTLFERVL